MSAAGGGCGIALMTSKDSDCQDSLLAAKNATSAAILGAVNDSELTPQISANFLLASSFQRLLREACWYNTSQSPSRSARQTASISSFVTCAPLAFVGSIPMSGSNSTILEPEISESLPTTSSRYSDLFLGSNAASITRTLQLRRSPKSWMLLTLRKNSQTSGEIENSSLPVTSGYLLP